MAEKKNESEVQQENVVENAENAEAGTSAGTDEVFSADDNFYATAMMLRKSNPRKYRIIPGLKVNNATVNENEGAYGTYRTLVLTLDKKIPAMQSAGEGVPYVLGMSNQVWILESQLLAAVGQVESDTIKRYAKTMKNMTNDELARVLIGLVIDVCSIHVTPVDEATGEVNTYANPFSRNAVEREIARESYYNNVVKVYKTATLFNDAAISAATNAGISLSFQDFLSILK